MYKEEVLTDRATRVFGDRPQKSYLICILNGLKMVWYRQETYYFTDEGKHKNKNKD